VDKQQGCLTHHDIRNCRRGRCWQKIGLKCSQPQGRKGSQSVSERKGWCWPKWSVYSEKCRLCCEAHLEGMVVYFVIIDLVVLNAFFDKVEGRLKVEQTDFLWSSVRRNVCICCNVGGENAGIEANLPIDNLNGHTPNPWADVICRVHTWRGLD
jgi:hypothetical protein